MNKGGRAQGAGKNVPATEEQKGFVARLIREARFARGLTPGEAAKALKMSKTCFYRWERGDLANNTVHVVCWLLKDRVEGGDAAYWRERALLAERRLGAIHREIKQYAEIRRDLEGDGESSPSSVLPLPGTRARAA